MDKLHQIANDLLTFTKAKSIFLYGSRARGDVCKKSDYEIGVLMERKKYVSRSKIKKYFNFHNIGIFSFVYEDFIKYNPDTPFTKSIYMKEIIESGKTLTGEKIIENLESPQIALLDVIQDLRFNLGYALAAVHSLYNKDKKTALSHFTKSCFFGTKNYIIFKNKKFPHSYGEIVKMAKNLEEYSDLPKYALKLRKGKAKIIEQNFFRNISYLNKFIEGQLLKEYYKKGNKILIKGR